MRITPFIYGSAILIVGLITTGSIGLAQDAKSAPNSRAARSIEESASIFLREKTKAQNAQRAKLEQAGIKFGQYRSLVARLTNISRKESRGLAASTEAAIDTAFIEDIALELATLGFGAQDLRPGANATELVKAASNKIRLQASYSDYKILSDLVVGATVVGYRLPNAGTGGRALMELKIDNLYKGSADVGSTILVELQSGVTAGGEKLQYSGEFLPAPRTQVVALLSDIPRNIRSNDGRLASPSVGSTFSKMAEPLTVDGSVAKSYRETMPDVAIGNL
jgi:hypothetical protein